MSSLGNAKPFSSMTKSSYSSRSRSSVRADSLEVRTRPSSSSSACSLSCIARGANLFGPDAAEMRLIRDELGDLPLAGFYANGEISNNRLYGYTGVLALFL